jgi:PleD family two-component response regulator
MSPEPQRRRVLVAARPAEECALSELFTREPLSGWQPLQTQSFAQARFTLQHTTCDVVLVDEGLYGAEGPDGLAWLVQQKEAPLVFLAGAEAETSARAYEQGAAICLPRAATLDHPPLLAAALARAAQGAHLGRSHRRTRDTLHQCRRQIDRLVNLLWRTAPLDPGSHWCTQRHVLERLHEEVIRAERHGAPLTVAVWEVRAPEAEAAEADLAGWVPGQVTRFKRRCDVAGQYGPGGFLLLLVQTPRDGGVVCCRRMQQRLESESPWKLRGPLRASFGLATYAPEAASPKALLRQAEEHLDEARGGAREWVVAG